MTKALYDKGREGFLDGSIDWDTGDIKVVLVDKDDYAVNLATHTYLSDVPAGTRVATTANLTGKTVTAGVADAADTVFSAVSGDVCEALIIYQDSGAPASSRLIVYIADEPTMGLPITPNGLDINLTFDNGANKIFKL